MGDDLPEVEHSIIVGGVWHNDSTAGVAVYCNTCNTEILYAAEELTPTQIAEAVAAHSDEAQA